MRRSLTSSLTNSLGSRIRVRPRFLHSNLCFIVIKDTAPTAVMNSILEEFKVWQSSGDGSIKVNGEVYALVLRRPVPPARLRRNAIPTQAKKFVQDHGKDVKKDIDIC